MKITGQLVKKFDTNQVSEKFKKREFVIGFSDGKFNQEVIMQVVNDKCQLLDSVNEGDTLEVDYALQGRAWENAKGVVRYFNTLSAFKITKGQKKEAAPDNDLPW